MPNKKSTPTNQNDTTLIAVLTAAVAASLNTPPSNLKIKSFRRVYDSTPAWNRAGRADIIASRL